MRVLMIGPLPPPVGGMATVMQNLLSGLGDKVEVRAVDNVKTTAPDRSLWQGIASQLRLLARLAGQCLVWRPRIVHIHTCSWFTFWRNAVDVLLAKLLLRRVVLHIHGAEFRSFLGGLPRVKAAMARAVFRLTDRVVVLGTGWKALLDEWADPRKVAIVPNGVPVSRPVAPSGSSELRVVCLANYERRKGQADLLRAAASVPGVSVSLLGFESEPGQRQALQEQARDLGMAGRVDLPGPVMGGEKEERFRAANVFCLPSYDEGLPMSMLEAMALGLPVVVTRVGAIPEAVVDGEEGLLFEPGDIDALEAHLKSLLDDPERAARLGRAGRERLKRDFSLERSVALLLAIYRGL